MKSSKSLFRGISRNILFPKLCKTINYNVYNIQSNYFKESCNNYFTKATFSVPLEKKN